MEFAGACNGNGNGSQAACAVAKTPERGAASLSKAVETIIIDCGVGKDLFQGIFRQPRIALTSSGWRDWKFCMLEFYLCN